MATNLTEVAHYLDNRQWRYYIETEKDRILTGVRAENVDEFLIVIQLFENGEFIQFRVPGLAKMKDQVFKGIAFQTLLNITYNFKMIKFGYDTEDGEVCACVELPLEDAPLTQRQFNRCLSGLINLVDQTTMPRLQAVLSTGEDPGQTLQVQQLLESMPSEWLDLMEQMVNLRRQQQDS